MTNAPRTKLRSMADTERQFQLLRCARKLMMMMRKPWHQLNTETQLNALANEAQAWDRMMRHAHSIAADAVARRDDCERRLRVLQQQRFDAEP